MEEKTRRNEGLKGFLLSQIEEKGPLPFSQFMEGCLYHPEFGYYRSEKIRVGKNGDYYTAPCVHPLFGHMIAKQLFQMSTILGTETFDVVEMGAGRGFLCRDVLDWAKANSPDFFRRLRYHLIEIAPGDLEERTERLSEYEKEGKIFSVDLDEFEKGKLEVEGSFLSNELVDAFPVHRVVFDRGALKELFVVHRNGAFEEAWGAPSEESISRYMESMGMALEEGQKAEVNLNALDWIKNVARCLKRGFALTIDYGHLAEELYASYRREGTLLSYFQHRTSQNPFERPGEQDITSHVNFTGLIKKGEEVGLRFTGLVPQYRFLIGLGLLQEVEASGRRMTEVEGLRLRLSLKRLIEPEAGMGEIFKVLIQHKGVEKPRLDGLRDLRSIPWG
jgi:SAM-dependent MidA family methyltransferase